MSTKHIITAVSKVFSSSFLLLAALALCAEPTPMDIELKDDSVINIECDYATKGEKYIGFTRCPELSPLVNKQQKAYHYNLYIPQDYSKNPDAYYGCLFIASPGGNAGMGQFAARLKRDRWIVVMLVESKNDDSRYLTCFLAAHDDVVKRMRIAEGAKFATGFSGGARFSSTWPLVRSGFAGILCQGAGFIWTLDPVPFEDIYAKYPKQVAIAGTFGTKDFNLKESYTLWKMHNPQSKRWVEVFEGAHEGSPLPCFERAMDWLEEETFIEKAPKAEFIPLILKSPVKLENLGKNAYLWYYNALKRRLAAAQGKFEKYLLMEQMDTVARNGTLNSAADIKTELDSFSKEMTQLKADPELQKEFAAKMEYAIVAKTLDALDSEMAKGQCPYNEKVLDAKEKKAFETFYKACDKFVEKYPDTYYAKKLSERKAGLILEFKP